MNNWMNPAIQQALLATLLHSIWQAALVALILFLLFRFLKQRSSQFRYLMAVTGLSMVLIMAIATFLITWSPAITTYNYEITALSASTTVSEPSVLAQSDFSLAWNQWLLANAHYLIYVWYLGVIIMSIRFMGGYMMVVRLRFVGLQTLSESWGNRIQVIKQGMNLNSDLRIYESSQVAVPLTFGFFKPLILLPLGLVNGMNTKELETILVHELYHIKRHDFLVNVFQALVEVLLFYHPAVWWISAKIREEREYCCDDATIAFTQQPINYAKALTQLQSNQVFTKPNFVMAATQNQGQLTKRVYRLFNQNTIHERGRAAILFLLILSLSAFTFLQKGNFSENQPDLEVPSLTITYSAESVEALKSHNEDRILKLNPPVTITQLQQSSSPNKLLILNGQEVKSLQQISDLDPNKAYFITQIKPEQAQEQWGKQFTKGAILMESEDVHSSKNPKPITSSSNHIIVERTDTTKNVNQEKELKSESTQIKVLRRENSEITPIAFLDLAINVLQPNELQALIPDQIEGNTDQKEDANLVHVQRKNDKEPLYILDDLEISKEQLNKVDPNSIKTIQVLKGEAAKKLYGEKGINGVILIYTKKSKKSKEIKNLIEQSGVISINSDPNDAVVSEETPVIYPNPATDFFSVDFTITSENSVVSLKLLKENGEKVAEVAPKNYPLGKNTYRFENSLLDLKPGLYFLEIKIDNEITRKRVIKE